MDSLPQLTFLPDALENVRIKSLPSSAFYIADFITKEEEQVLLNKVSRIPPFLSISLLSALVHKEASKACSIADLHESRSKQRLNLDGSNYLKGASKHGRPI